MREGTEYWFCIMGPINSELLPDGADYPPRRAAQDAIIKMTGTTNFGCWSGWGVTEEEKERILRAGRN